MEDFWRRHEPNRARFVKSGQDSSTLDKRIRREKRRVGKKKRKIIGRLERREKNIRS
jgi:hypothetical protein